MKILRFLFIAFVIAYIALLSYAKSDRGRTALRERLQLELQAAVPGTISIGHVVAIQPDNLQLKAIEWSLPGDMALQAEELFLATSLQKWLMGTPCSAQMLLRNVAIKQGNVAVEIGEISIDIAMGKDQQWPAHIALVIPNGSGQWQGELHANWQQTHYRLHGQWHDGGFSHLKVQGLMPTSTDQPMALTFTAERPLALLAQMIMPTELHLSGKISAQVHLAGCWAAPICEGSIDLADGSVENFASGALFQQLQGHGTLVGNAVVIETLSARDPQGGTIAATGHLKLSPEELFPFALALDLNRANLVAIDELQGSFSGNLQLKGHSGGGMLSGTLMADQLAFDLEECQAAVESPLEITYVQGGATAPLSSASSPGAASQAVRWPLELAVDLRSGSSIAISGHGLQSKWKSDLRLTGYQQAIQLHGDVSIVSGEYSFNGRKLKISQGQISFAGPPGSKSSLYAVGELQVADIAIQVVLSGPLDNPLLFLRSTPQLSQREILAWILFGRGMGEISSFQGAELDRSIDILKANRQQPGLLDRIKSTTGIDRIDFKNGEGADNAEFSLQLGKYLSPNIFLGVSIASIHRLAIEVNMSKNIKFQADIDGDAQRNFQLKWKHDY
jgi:translocation and assembly module TamB